jgi:DNA-binding transcriptional LysR family regulator
MPSGHELAGCTTLSYVETLGYEHVEQNQSSALSQLLDYAAKQSSSVKKTRIRIRGFDGVCNMIGLGMGIGIVPSFLGATYASLYNLHFVPLTDSWAHPVICIMFRNRESLPFAARALVSYLDRHGSATIANVSDQERHRS